MGKNIKMENEPMKKRGRPAGKGRIPLSVEERRARNAMYERERRLETAGAMSALAEAAGCGPGIRNSDLLATVINLLSRAQNVDPNDDVISIRRCNENLMQQIQTLEARLGSDSGMAGTLVETNNDPVMRTHTNAAGRKKIKFENTDCIENAPVKAKAGKQRARCVKKENVSPVPSEGSVEEWSVKIEPSSMQGYEMPSPPISEYATGIPDVTEVLPSGSGDLENLGCLEPSLSSEQFGQEMRADDGVLDWIRHWSVEDFAIEYL